MRTAPALTLPTSAVASALAGHDDPTGQAGAPPCEGRRHPNVARWSSVSKGGTR